MRGRLIAGLVTAAALAVPAGAQATATLELRYEPPVITLIDHLKIGTTDVVGIARFGENIAFTTESPGGFSNASGCTFDFLRQSYDCPAAGVERIIGRMGAGDDTVKTSIRGYSQKFIGGDGKDQLTAKAGNQTLKGGAGKDLLKGGRGDDVLIGGPGQDTCRGGPGDDKIKKCE